MNALDTSGPCYTTPKASTDFNADNRMMIRDRFRQQEKHFTFFITVVSFKYRRL